MKQLLEVRNLHYTYEDGTQALRGVSMDIKTGKRIALLGSNGCGKTTFFLCLNGVLRPQQGEILMEGMPVRYNRKGLRTLRKQVGIVFQDPENQLFCSSVYQEVSFGALNTGMSEQEAALAVEEVMDLLRISPFRDRPVHALSGGQKKQVAIADILVMNPQLVLLDEPSASLDPTHTRLVEALVETLTARGITVMIATHDMDYAYSWAEEAVVFHEGQILKQGDPVSVFSDSNAVEKAGLAQPACLQLYRSMVQRGILPPASPPRSIQNLQELIENDKGR